jgi:hypothetical protein
MIKINYGNYTLIDCTLHSNKYFESCATKTFRVKFINGGIVVNGACDSFDIFDFSEATPIINRWFNRQKYDIHFRFNQISLMENDTRDSKIITFDTSETPVNLKFPIAAKANGLDVFSEEEQKKLINVWDEIAHETGDYYVYAIFPAKSKIEGSIQVMNNRPFYYRNIEDAQIQCDFSHDEDSKHRYEVRSL